MAHLSKKKLEELNGLLLEEKSALENELAESELDESIRDSTGELTAIDNHPADAATEVFERSKDLALNEHHTKQLEEVYNALARIETGEYGKCETCGTDIPFERLQALPYTSYCIEHTPDRTVSDSRPVEEQIMGDLPGRDAGDDRTPAQHDDADAWHAVAVYGNADSPAMSEKREVRSYNEMADDGNEIDGSVEQQDGFVATDIYGKQQGAVRGRAYDDYINAEEGEAPLESDERKGSRRKE
jgi:DnaK suppressor protein